MCCKPRLIVSIEGLNEVLGEIIHQVIGETAQGPFRISGIDKKKCISQSLALLSWYLQILQAMEPLSCQYDLCLWMVSLTTPPQTNSKGGLGF